MKKFICISIALLMLLAALAACTEKDPVVDQPPVEKPESGISNVVNSYESKSVSFRGATISVKFDAAAAWTASLALKTMPEDEWAEISSSTLSGNAKKGCNVRVAFEENKTSDERVAELWVEVEGFEPECIATLRQAASGTSADAEINQALNTYMHEILSEDYLFAEAYNSQQIDLTVPYNEFLSAHLLSLGDVNIEDGGYRKASQENAGARFIYTSLVEIQATRAIETGGLGFGPFISTALSANGSEMAIAPSFVRRGSPAEAAGLRRGDLVYAVNGTRLTTITVII